MARKIAGKIADEIVNDLNNDIVCLASCLGEFGPEKFDEIRLRWTNLIVKNLEGYELNRRPRGKREKA